MKKKLLSVIILLFSIIGLVSCNKTNKILIQRESTITESIDLYATNKDKPNLQKLVDDKKSFLLFGYLNFCQDCALFKDIYDNFAKTNNAIIYKAELTDIQLVFDDAPNRAPYLTIVRDGKMSELFTFQKNKSIFVNKDEFNKFINKYFELDKTVRITLERDLSIKNSIDLYATDKDNANLKELVDDKKSFLLFGYLPQCMDCKLFTQIYEKYVNENKVVLYKSTVSDINIIFNDSPMKAPYLTIIRNGKMKEIFLFKDHKKLFTDENEFKRFIDDNFILEDLETMIDIDKLTLDKYLSENKEFVVYFGWNKCSDCSFMEEAYLDNFLKTNKKQFYYFETDPYRPKKDATIEENNKWKEFKLHYGFGTYNEGRVPSIVYYKDGKCQDFAVYLNDIIEFDNTNNKVIVKDSYYKDNPYIGKEFKGSSLGEAYLNYKEECKSFFNKKMDEFFAKYLK